MTTHARATRRNLRKRRVRAAISGTATRPRLSVFRSNTQFSAQLIDDESATTIAAVSSKTQKGASAREKIEATGTEIAKRAQEKGITKVVFDRSGFLYTGNVKAFADAARAGGLEF